MKSLVAYVSSAVRTRSCDVAANKPNNEVVRVGATIPVGELFWIKTCIGMAENAVHGHGSSRMEGSSPGSADVDCQVRVLDIRGDYAVVVLLRPAVPYGAPAPHGTIFVVPVSTLKQWPAMTEHRISQELARSELRRSLGRVRA